MITETNTSITEISHHSIQVILKQITYDNDFIVEHSETSDTRPYTASNIISEPTFEEYDQSFLQSNQDDNTEIFHDSEPPQLNKI